MLRVKTAGEAEDGRGVFLRLEAGVGAKLVGGIPEALFKAGVVCVFLGWGYPLHGRVPRLLTAVISGFCNAYYCALMLLAE